MTRKKKILLLLTAVEVTTTAALLGLWALASEKPYARKPKRATPPEDHPREDQEP